MRNSTNHWRTALICAALVALAIVPYWRTFGFDFIAYDDKAYIWENPTVLRGLTWDNVAWAFTTIHVSNWHPLTWLSHLLDVSLFGPTNAGGHHLMNVLLHALNALVLFATLLRMTLAPWRSALVAALFAVHPLHVESVAWVAERKDVLSTFFGLLAIYSYARYAERLSLGRYATVVCLFALSLMAKPMLVTLPFVLLLLDVWPLKRLSLQSFKWTVFLEKLPLLAMSVASSIMTIIAQTQGGSVYPLELLPIEQRFDNALIAYVQYLMLTLWPANLAVIYPHPRSWPIGLVFASAGVLLAISALVGVLSRKRPVLLVGWLWYLGTLVPVIGILQVGLQSMADRYTYVPLIGIFIMIAWGIPDLTLRSRSWRFVSTTAAVAAIVALAVAARIQVGYWKNTVTLFTRTLQVTDDNLIAHNILGFALAREGKTDEAIEHYRTALAINNNYAAAHSNFGSALITQGKIDEAIGHLKEAQRLNPDSWPIQQNLGAALSGLGRYAEAIPYFSGVLKELPEYHDAHLGLAMALANTRQMQEAIPQYEAALKSRPDDPQTMVHYGVALAAVDRFDDAIAQFQRALSLQPDHAEARRFLEIAQAQKAQGGGS